MDGYNVLSIKFDTFFEHDTDFRFLNFNKKGFEIKFSNFFQSYNPIIEHSVIFS